MWVFTSAEALNETVTLTLSNYFMVNVGSSVDLGDISPSAAVSFILSPPTLWKSNIKLQDSINKKLPIIAME